MENFFIIFIAIFFIIAVIVHIKVDSDLDPCYFGHKWVKQKEGWSHLIKIYSPIYLYRYKCKVCGENITTHYSMD